MIQIRAWMGQEFREKDLFYSFTFFPEGGQGYGPQLLRLLVLFLELLPFLVGALHQAAKSPSREGTDADEASLSPPRLWAVLDSVLNPFASSLLFVPGLHQVWSLPSPISVQQDVPCRS
mmetsp:Transcript_10517/g.14654  ORF Transcript_10517/g.14654 Transcript_10517/m.14654 type:complete len:119 (+) Transcript_10517:476-832(+)